MESASTIIIGPFPCRMRSTGSESTIPNPVS